MRKNLNIICIQANPTVGAIKANFDKVRAFRAAHSEADLLVFSEMFCVGYPIQDLALRPSFIRDFSDELNHLVTEMKAGDGPAVLIGGPLAGPGLPYNAIFLIETDGSVECTLKHNLPNSEVYDERRTFAQGPLPTPVRFRGYKLGIAICEDFWHGQIIRCLAEEGAEIIISPNGSHFRVGKQTERLALGHRHAKMVGLPIIYVNQVGGQDELVFDGGSFVMNKSGGVEVETGFKECVIDLLVRDIAGELVIFNKHEDRHHGRDYPENIDAAVYRALVLGLRDYVNKNGFPGLIIGMSGGLDSALSAAIAVDALGPDKVILVRMPSALTSGASMDDAAEVASMLGCRLETVSIAPAVDAYESMLRPLFVGKSRDVTEENIQARTRGMILMALSNKFGFMVLSTGNKSEMSVGYATLYGDMCGGFSVLKDVFKTTAFRLSAWRNGHLDMEEFGFLGKNAAVMPERIITKPPSAELSEDQTDEATLGSYEDLDAVLYYLVDDMNDAAAAARFASTLVGHKISVEYAKGISGLVSRAEYKRRQGPMGIVVSNRSYDKGWRLPVTNAYGLT